MNNLRSFLLFLTATGVAAAIFGCGGPSKADLALAHVRSYKKPAWVRLLNLSDQTVTLKAKDRVVASGIRHGEASMMEPITPGMGKITIDNSKSAFDTNLSFDPDSASTLLLSPSGKSAGTILGEDRKPAPDANVRLFFVDESGKPVTDHGPLTLSAGATKMDIKSGDKSEELAVGNWTITGADLKSSIDTRIGKGNAYSFIFVKGADGKFTGYTLTNTDTRAPVSAGSAKA